MLVASAGAAIIGWGLIIVILVVVYLRWYANGLEKDKQAAVVKTLKCPTCHAQTVSKIKTGSKVASAATVGVFAVGKISKTFTCRNCGFTW